jgi:hypothetical protein
LVSAVLNTLNPISMSASGWSDLILSPALRIRSLPISHIFL